MLVDDQLDEVKWRINYFYSHMEQQQFQYRILCDKL